MWWFLKTTRRVTMKIDCRPVRHRNRPTKPDCVVYFFASITRHQMIVSLRDGCIFLGTNQFLWNFSRFNHAYWKGSSISETDAESDVEESPDAIGKNRKMEEGTRTKLRSLAFDDRHHWWIFLARREDYQDGDEQKRTDCSQFFTASRYRSYSSRRTLTLDLNCSQRALLRRSRVCIISMVWSFIVPTSREARQYLPISLRTLQRLIDLRRINPAKPIDLPVLCNTKLFSIQPDQRQFGLQLIDEVNV